MDISSIISTNLTAWMAATPSLDTLQKLEAKSGVGFGTIRRAKNGDGNLTVNRVAAIAAAFGRTPAELMMPAPTESTEAAAQAPRLSDELEQLHAEATAKIVIEQAGEVLGLWATLTPERRLEWLQQLRVEAGHRSGDGRTLTALSRKPGQPASVSQDTKARREAD